MRCYILREVRKNSRGINSEALEYRRLNFGFLGKLLGRTLQEIITKGKGAKKDKDNLGAEEPMLRHRKMNRHIRNTTWLIA